MLVIAIGAFAQDPTPSQFEYIKGLEPFVGDWEAKPPQGEERTLILSCRFTSNRSYLRMEASTEIDGERENSGIMLIGRDFDKDQVSMWGFWNDAQTRGKVVAGNATVEWNEMGVRDDGRKSSATIALKVDSDELTFDVTNVKRGGESLPELHLKFVRSQRLGSNGR